jgi:hypothetical protein
VKHGVLATAPILPGIESRKDWEKHRDALFESYPPVGYLEELLTHRLAILSWRLLRVVRYEAEVAAAATAKAESDLDYDKPSDPAQARGKVEIASLIIEMLRALPNMTEGSSLDKNVAVATLWALWKELPEEAGDLSVPGLPDDDAGFNAFDRWTADVLRKAIEVYAAAARTSPETLIDKTIASAYKNRDEAGKEELELVRWGKEWKLRLQRESRSRMLLEPDLLDKVARYETGLERSFFRTFHELQRLRAARSGAVVPPPEAIDVDLTVHPEGRSPVSVDAKNGEDSTNFLESQR